jgi:hypothetical protein
VGKPNVARSVHLRQAPTGPNTPDADVQPVAGTSCSARVPPMNTASSRRAIPAISRCSDVFIRAPIRAEPVWVDPDATS